MGRTRYSRDIRCLLDDDYAFHPQMDVAVVVVCACSRECELVDVATAHGGAPKRGEATVRRRVCRYGVWGRSAILPDNRGSVSSCVVGDWTEVTCGIGWAGAASAVVL